MAGHFLQAFKILGAAVMHLYHVEPLVVCVEKLRSVHVPEGRNRLARKLHFKVKAHVRGEIREVYVLYAEAGPHQHGFLKFR